MCAFFNAGYIAKRKTSLVSRIYLISILVISTTAFSQVQKPVNLGSASHFVVLAGSLVSNIPGSKITGDIGLSPASGSQITGFGLLEVTGNIYTVDATGPAGSVIAASELTTAKGDLTIAYNDAAGRMPVPVGPFLNPGAGNIGGMTLIPGLYKFKSTASITGSNLTLTGNATDVWIFQIASDLNVGNGIQVILTGGAKASNIFWQVGTSATLGTTSAFKGTIIADQSISLNTGAVLDGRAFASIAAVTLASNRITIPTANPTPINNAITNNNVMMQNYAIRENSTSNLIFFAPSSGKLTLTVMNTSGQQVLTLFDGITVMGMKSQLQINTNGLSKGIYTIHFNSEGMSNLISKLIIF